MRFCLFYMLLLPLLACKPATDGDTAAPSDTSDSADTDNCVRICQDRDRDGFGNPNVTDLLCPGETLPSGWIPECSDCDDDDPSIHVQGVEVVGDGVDQDCDGDDDTSWMG